MEKRDGYFTKLKHTIEAYYITTGEKVVLVSHSMGGTVSYYFLQWVTADVKNGGGGGGKNWVDKHIQSFVNIAGTLLGVPKSIPALMSGELKDTAQMFPQLGELLKQLQQSHHLTNQIHQRPLHTYLIHQCMEDRLLQMKRWRH